MNLVLSRQLILELAIQAAALLVLILSCSVLMLMHSPGFFPCCSTAHCEHLNSHAGDFPCPIMESVNSKGAMPRKERSGSSQKNLLPLASESGLLLFATHLRPH